MFRKQLILANLEVPGREGSPDRVSRARRMARKCGEQLRDGAHGEDTDMPDMIDSRNAPSAIDWKNVPGTTDQRNVPGTTDRMNVPSTIDWKNKKKRKEKQNKKQKKREASPIDGKSCSWRHSAEDSAARREHIEEGHVRIYVQRGTSILIPTSD